MNKKILILGASILQVPAILKAKEKGYIVACVDQNPNSAGVQYADMFYNISTIDEQRVYQAALDFAPDGIMTLASDLPMRTVAYIAERLDLPGISIESALISTDKARMMELFTKNKVSSPWYYCIDTEEALDTIIDNLEYPCIVKPVDNSGSRGVILIHNEDQLKDGYCYSKSHSRSGKVIIEEFLQGNEVSVETLTVNNRTNVIAITDKLTSGEPYFVELGHSQPCQLPRDSQAEIANLAINAVKAVGINTGPAHVEIMMTDYGPRIIELGARLGGDCIATHLVPLSTGFDMVAAAIDLCCGKDINIGSLENRGSAIRFLDAPTGYISKISGVDEAMQCEGVREIYLMKKTGDYVGGLHNSTDRVGYVIAQGTDAKQAVSYCDTAISAISIVTEKGGGV